jgi:hypothetical protein
MTRITLTQEQIKQLKENYKKQPLKQIAQTIGISPSVLRRFVRKHEVLFDEEPIQDGVKVPAFKLTVSREEGIVVVNIKTNRKFEQYLMSSRTIAETKNFFGKRERSQFYVQPLFHASIDDINQDVFINGEFNFAILRVPNISKGLVYRTNYMISDEQLELAMKHLIEKFKIFYNSSVISGSLTAVIFETSSHANTEAAIKRVLSVDVPKEDAKNVSG